MNMSTWAIRTPVPTIALFMVLCVLGLFSFNRIPVTLFPNIDIPIITISVGQAGAAPSELSTQVVQPIEDAVSSIVGVDHVSATASDSSAQITVQFALEVDTDRALNDVKDAIASVRGDLPDAITEPIVRRLDVEGGAILTYAVSDPTRSIEDLSYFVDEVIARDLQVVDGVSQALRLGGADQEIKVELEPDRLLALGITASEVSNQLRSTNIDLGGGRGDLAGQEFSIRALGAASSVEALAATPLSLSNGRTIRLDQIGTVADGPAEARSFAMNNGQPVVALGVFRASGASDLSAGDAAKEKMAEIIAEYPNVEVALIDDTTINTEGTFESSMSTLYEGALLAIFVVFIFLRNWRATIITAIALPLSIIPTFFVMQYLGFSLNTISLLGITLVTGILVDDAIVEIENIVRHIQMGKPAYEASEEAANEIGLTVIAISFTIVAVFAPVSFMPGIAGQYFKQFGLTVAVAVLFSLLVARLVTPMVSAYFLRGAHAPAEEKDGMIMRAYMRVLRWTLRNRFVTLVLGVLIFIGSIYSATLLPNDFIPVSDEGRSVISVELPPGATLGDTRDVARNLSEQIIPVADVQNVFVEGGTGDITKARIVVNYGQKGDRDRSSFAIEDEIKELVAGTPDVRLNFLTADGARDVTVSILGDSEELASRAAVTLADAVSTLPELENVSTSASLIRPEIQIIPKPELAAELGITASALASTVRVATIGDTEANLAKFNTGDRQIPVVVRLKEEVRHDLVQMLGQRIPSTKGAPVPVGVVADLRLSAGPSAIERYDRQYLTKIEADFTDGALLGPVIEKIYALPAVNNLPEGTEIQRSGDAEIMAEIFESFALAMGAGIMLVYVVLVLLFHSFVTPITILLSLPLAIGGAILALYLMNYAISLPVVIGFLMLMGIVTKNAIMLVEFALEAMKDGVERNAAMIDAGHKRARPIIMTTVAMTAGMVPSALAIGTGGEFRAPMAVAVIGGLLVSTMLSLLFVPSLFSVINGAKTYVSRVAGRFLGANRPASTT